MDAPEVNCNHDKFKDSKCVDCGLPCEHWEIDEGVCLSCGKQASKDVDLDYFDELEQENEEEENKEKKNENLPDTLDGTA